MANEEKKCKYCAMMIPKEAKICPFCHKKMPISKGVGFAFIIIFGFLIIWSIASQQSPPPSTPPVGSDPKNVTDRQIYREYEICMRSAEQTIKENKLQGQDMGTMCFAQLQKYGKERAKKAFATYYDFDYNEKKKGGIAK